MIKVGKNLAETLRHGRRLRDISQEQLAETMNVTRQTISNWETGLVVPPMRKLERLSRELDIPLAQLLGEEAQAAPPEAKEPEAAAPVVPEHRPRRWPAVLVCIGLACALVIGIISLIGIYSIKHDLNPVDTAVPVEEMTREEVDRSSIGQVGFDQAEP